MWKLVRVCNTFEISINCGQSVNLKHFLFSSVWEVIASILKEIIVVWIVAFLSEGEGEKDDKVWNCFKKEEKRRKEKPNVGPTQVKSNGYQMAL